MNSYKWNLLTICKIDFTITQMITVRKLFKLKTVKLIINKMKMRNYIIKKEILLMKILKSKERIHILKIISIQI
jgi:hypothetical protein